MSQNMDCAADDDCPNQLPPRQRYNFNVPFKEKDAAKRMGARFDVGKKVW